MGIIGSKAHQKLLKLLLLLERLFSYGIVSRILFRQMSGDWGLGIGNGEQVTGNLTKTVRITGEALTLPPKLYGAQSKFLI